MRVMRRKAALAYLLLPSLVVLLMVSPTALATGPLASASASGSTASIVVSVDPVVHVHSHDAAHVGSSVRVNGTGFAPDSAITFSLTGGTVTSRSACQTNSHGKFLHCRFVLPPTPAGTQQVTATDGSSDSAQTALVVLSSVDVVSSDDVNVGGSVTFDGYGFAADSAITFTTASGGAMIQSSCSTDAYGSFVGCTATVPPHRAATLHLDAKDGAGNVAETSVVLGPSLSILAPRAGVAGSTVTVDGAGYSADSAIVFSVAGSPVTSQSACTSNSAGNFTGCTFVLPVVSPGTNTVSVAVTGTDASDRVNTNTALYTEVVPVVAGAFTPGSPAIDYGQALTLDAAATGGTGTFDYLWFAFIFPISSCSGILVGNTTVPSLDFGALDEVPDTYYVCYIAIDTGVTDPAGPANYAASPVETVTVYYDPAAGVPSATSTLFDYTLGSSTLTPSVTGGSGGYTFAWYVDSSDGGTCGESPTETFLGYGASWTTGSEVTGAGTYYYCYVVNDTFGVYAASGYQTITVDPTLLAGTPAVTQAGIDYGQVDDMNAQTSGGAGANEYLWWVSPTDSQGCPGPDVDLLDFAFLPDPGWATGSEVTGPGTYYYCDTVRDATGAEAQSGWATITVDSALSATPSATVNPVTAGSTTVISTTVSGGSGLYSYTWSGLPSGCSAPATTVGSFDCTPSLFAGSSTPYTVQVVANDSNGGSVTSSFGLTVNPGALAVAIDRTGALVVTYPETFTADVAGGTPPYTSYVWKLTPSGSGCVLPSGTTNSSFTCNFEAGNFYNITLSVTDSSSTTVSVTLAFAVASDGGCRPHGGFCISDSPAVSVHAPAMPSASDRGTATPSLALSREVELPRALR